VLLPPSLPLLLQAAGDLKRDAGLRGDELDAAVLGLIAVFVVGFGLIAVVLLRGRRKRKT
jgi:hypothetical protein